MFLRTRKIDAGDGLIDLRDPQTGRASTDFSERRSASRGPELTHEANMVQASPRCQLSDVVLQELDVLKRSAEGLLPLIWRVIFKWAAGCHNRAQGQEEETTRPRFGS